MFGLKTFALLVAAASVSGSAVAPRNTSSVAFVPIAARRNVAAVQFGASATAITRLFYQDESTGDIMLHATINGPFTTGQTANHRIFVPGSEVHPFTPIAATAIGDGTNGIHVYFLSPDRKLSEWRYTSTGGWRGGSGCPDCIDRMAFSVTDGSDVLYALEHPTSNVLRVGFVSPGVPGTLVEAITANSGATWSLAPLPDA